MRFVIQKIRKAYNIAWLQHFISSKLNYVCASETTGKSIRKYKMSLPYLETGALIIWRLEVKQRQV